MHPADTIIFTHMILILPDFLISNTKVLPTNKSRAYEEKYEPFLFHSNASEQPFA